jgi:serine/threonine-protein kinase
MKRCPECRRDYFDDSLLFCLEDGAALIQGSVPSPDEPATAIIPAASFGVSTVSARTAFLETAAKSIAVLPFAHLSSDPDNEYFCEGLAEELLNALSRVDGLKVAARTSSFFYKGKDVKIDSIGRELGVGSVLEGSVRKSGDHLRITVQLVNASDGYQLWSERYDRQMDDIFQVQDEIALAVVEALKLKLIGEQRSALLKKGTENREAFELYLRGRALWNSRTRGGFQKAIENFEQAIEIDPEYALAYAAMADCYSFLAYFGGITTAEAAPKARAAVDKAMSLDPGLAECRTAKAAVDLFFAFDFDSAEREYLAAIEINPQYLHARYLYCALLTARRQFERAIDEGRTAVRMDPLSPHANTQLARALCCAGRPGEAIELITKILEVMPDFHHLHWILGWAYGETGQWESAIIHYRTAVETGGPFLYGFLGNALVKGGHPDEARALLEKLYEQARHGIESPVSAAEIEGALGNISKGLDLLDQASEMRIVHLMWIAVDPVFDSFRGEPRFLDLLNKLNLT